jgi:hypothetical protein
MKTVTLSGAKFRVETWYPADRAAAISPSQETCRSQRPSHRAQRSSRRS